MSSNVREDVTPVSEVEHLLSVLPPQRQLKLLELGQVEEGERLVSSRRMPGSASDRRPASDLTHRRSGRMMLLSDPGYPLPNSSAVSRVNAPSDVGSSSLRPARRSDQSGSPGAVSGAKLTRLVRPAEPQRVELMEAAERRHVAIRAPPHVHPVQLRLPRERVEQLLRNAREEMQANKSCRRRREELDLFRRKSGAAALHLLRAARAASPPPRRRTHPSTGPRARSPSIVAHPCLWGRFPPETTQGPKAASRNVAQKDRSQEAPSTRSKFDTVAP